MAGQPIDSSSPLQQLTTPRLLYLPILCPAANHTMHSYYPYYAQLLTHTMQIFTNESRFFSNAQHRVLTCLLLR